MSRYRLSLTDLVCSQYSLDKVESKKQKSRFSSKVQLNLIDLSRGTTVLWNSVYNQNGGFEHVVNSMSTFWNHAEFTKADR